MTDKNRIQRENMVAEALLGPGKTARNLMRLLFSAYENGSELAIEISPPKSAQAGSVPVCFRALPRIVPSVFGKSANARIATQPAAPAPFDGDAIISKTMKEQSRIAEMLDDGQWFRRQDGRNGDEFFSIEILEKLIIEGKAEIYDNQGVEFVREKLPF